MCARGEELVIMIIRLMYRGFQHEMRHQQRNTRTCEPVLLFGRWKKVRLRSAVIFFLSSVGISKVASLTFYINAPRLACLPCSLACCAALLPVEDVFQHL